MNKYGAIKCEQDGIKFDSKAEKRRFDRLRLLELAGEISELQTHPRFELAPKIGSIRALHYTPDFTYTERGKKIAEDVKGVVTESFRLRANLFKRAYPEIELRVIK